MMLNYTLRVDKVISWLQEQLYSVLWQEVLCAVRSSRQYWSGFTSFLIEYLSRDPASLNMESMLLEMDFYRLMKWQAAFLFCLISAELYCICLSFKALFLFMYRLKYSKNFNNVKYNNLK